MSAPNRYSTNFLPHIRPKVRNQQIQKQTERRIVNELVYIKNNDIFTDSLKISEATGNQNRSIVALTKKHIGRFERFGKVGFIDLKSQNLQGGRPQKVVVFNEPQATLLISMLDNNDVVADFKVELVKQFYQMRKILMERGTETWVETRKQSRLGRTAETDTIKKFIEYAREQGSKNADKYYVHFTNLANKLVGIESGGRDMASVFQLNSLTFVESIILRTIESNLIVGTEYHEIFQKCKRAIDEFKDLTAYESLTQIASQTV